MASDEDLKLSDLLRYYERDSQAALVSIGYTLQGEATMQARGV